MPERAGEFLGLAHIEDLHRPGMLLKAVRIDFPHPGEAVAQRRPPRVRRRRAFRRLVDLGLAAAQIGRHRDIHQLGMGEAEVLHVAGKIADADLAADARVEAALLADAGHRQPAVVMRGVEQAIIGQGEDLLVDRAVHRRRVAALEIGAAGAADHQAISGKGHAAVVEHKGQAAIGMTGGGAHHQPAAAERHDIVLAQIAVGAGRAARLCEHDPAAGALLQQPGAGHVIGVDMGFQSGDELEAELAEERDIPPDLLEDGVDQDRLAARPIAEQIGVGRGLRVEELTEHQHRSPPAIRPQRRRSRRLVYVRHAAIGGAKKQAPIADNQMPL